MQTNSEPFGLNGTYEHHSPSPYLTQFQLDQVARKLVQPRFEYHQVYSSWTTCSNIKVGILNQVQNNTQRQRKPSH